MKYTEIVAYISKARSLQELEHVKTLIQKYPDEADRSGLASMYLQQKAHLTRLPSGKQQ
jgi:hypothetical protein